MTNDAHQDWRAVLAEISADLDTLAGFAREQGEGDLSMYMVLLVARRIHRRVDALQAEITGQTNETKPAQPGSAAAR